MSSTISIPDGAGHSHASAFDSARSPWIHGPWLDLIVGCGAWSAPLLLLANNFAFFSAKSWSFAFYALALLLNCPHFMATIYRAYHSYDQFAKYRFYTVYVTLLFLGAGLAAHFWYPLLPWVFTLFICWSPWHYSSQNYGLLMMFSGRAGVSPSQSERQALQLAFVASYLMLLFNFHTGASADPLVLSLGLPAKFTIPVQGALALFFLGAAGLALTSMARSSSWKAILPCVILVTTQILWFLLPVAMELWSGSPVPQIRYSSGVLAVLHSAQYLWFTSYYQSKEARAAGKNSWTLAGYFLILVAGGIALFIPGPWLASRFFHQDFAVSLLIFTAVVNLHHFALEGAVWKLRDPRIASLLLDEEQEPVAEKTVPGRLPTLYRWFAGATVPSRLLRVGLLVLLLLWGGLDVLHFYWGNVSANLNSLQRAAHLLPDDSEVQTRLAHAADAAGNRDLAMASLQRAAAANPANINLQESYARALILSGRDADAYEFYRNLLLRSPQNAEALVNYGILALKLGHEDEAVDSWQRAVAADPMQANAQLYLAQALEQRGEMQASAHHYRAYLQIAAKRPAEHSGEGATVISALIKVADADTAAKNFKEALIGYRRAGQFAEKMKNSELQSLALAHAAEAQEHAGSIADAAQSFQEALMLDETQGDPKAAATDWFNYGKFLQRQNQPEPLVFACFYRAQDLMSTNPGKELDAIAAEVTASQSRLGPSAAALPPQLSKLLSRALSLQPTAFASVKNH
jgi:tetratricopeptide (TPR) repeat protein